MSGLRPAWFTLGYLVFAFVGGALLAPWAWWAVHGDVPALSFFDFLERHDDFHRYVNRCVLGLAILALWPTLKLAGSASSYDMGLAKSGLEKRNLIAGFSIGIGSLAALAVLGIAISPMRLNLDYSAAEWGRHLLNAGIAMVLVSILEEILFRGVLFGNLRRAIPWQAAALMASLIFASVHFLGARPENPDPMHWHTGITFLGSMFHLGPWWLPKFLSLFLAGVVLCCLYQRTNNLYCSIAVHAGWILGGKTLVMVTDYNAVKGAFSPLDIVLWGKTNILEGRMTAGLLLCIAFYLFYYLENQQEQAEPDLADAT